MLLDVVEFKILDCARFLRSGRNEVHGIEPDLALTMNDLDTENFTIKLKEEILSSLAQKNK